MATRVTGLDIGRSSVKAVVIEASGRNWQLAEVVEEPIERPTTAPDDPQATPPMGQPVAPPEDAEAAPDPDEDVEVVVTGLDEPTRAALRRLAGHGVFDVDQIISALSDDDVYSATITLPFDGYREISAVLPPQLEGRLPVEAEDLVLDHMVSGKATNGENRVFAVAVDPGRLGLLLGDLNELGVDPRHLDVPPWSLFASLAALTPGSDEAVGIVDIGARTTNLLIAAGGNIQFARTMQGGGDRVTESLASMFDLPFDRAEDGKLREGFIDPQMREADGPTGDDAADIAQACRNGVKPLVRQLRRTLQAHASEAGQPVTRLYLAGGGATLPGLAEYIGQSLGVPTELIPRDTPELAAVAGFADVGHRFVAALGLALRGTSRPETSDLDLRKGAFAFRGSYDYLVQRAPSLAFGAVALLVAGLAFLFANNRLLAAEHNAVEDALSTMSESMFGESTADPGTIRRRMARGAALPGFVPERTATSLFVDIVNSAEETVNLGYSVRATDIEVDLERALVRVEGTADGAESVDEYQRVLAQVDCLYELRRDELSQRPGAEGFSFSIVGAATCNPEEDE